jgi:hypothetical protein
MSVADPPLTRPRRRFIGQLGGVSRVAHEAVSKGLCRIAGIDPHLIDPLLLLPGATPTRPLPPAMTPLVSGDDGRSRGLIHAAPSVWK